MGYPESVPAGCFPLFNIYFLPVFEGAKGHQKSVSLKSSSHQKGGEGEERRERIRPFELTSFLPSLPPNAHSPLDSVSFDARPPFLKALHQDSIPPVSSSPSTLLQESMSFRFKSELTSSLLLRLSLSLSLSFWTLSRPLPSRSLKLSPSLPYMTSLLTPPDFQTLKTKVGHEQAEVRRIPSSSWCVPSTRMTGDRYVSYDDGARARDVNPGSKLFFVRTLSALFSACFDVSVRDGRRLRRDRFLLLRRVAR